MTKRANCLLQKQMKLFLLKFQMPISSSPGRGTPADRRGSQARRFDRVQVPSGGLQRENFTLEDLDPREPLHLQGSFRRDEHQRIHGTGDRLRQRLRRSRGISGV